MRKLEDTYRHKGLRQKLVNELRTQKGIVDENVLTAINNIPRHFFLDSAFDNIAYEDRAFPIAANQTISQPYTVAFQSQLLQIKRGEKVLEIGTGSVYQAIILAEMGAMVYTIERQKELFELQKKNILLKKYTNIKTFYRDGFLGHPAFAPYDKILITAAAPTIPQTLVEQLKVNGILVLPLDEEGGKQRMLRLTKKEGGELQEERFEEFSFVPMLSGKNV
ncbi:MAG: protein-L-isoaspartate(D-aspartate) O-methyltransferase [Chitinophagaceae bacterium]|jgi:protein-L-isoaspartate(D-aspartate) O-methyltransferase